MKSSSLQLVIMMRPIDGGIEIVRLDGAWYIEKKNLEAYSKLLAALLYPSRASQPLVPIQPLLPEMKQCLRS